MAKRRKLADVDFDDSLLAAVGEPMLFAAGASVSIEPFVSKEAPAPSPSKLSAAGLSSLDRLSLASGSAAGGAPSAGATSVSDVPAGITLTAARSASKAKSKKLKSSTMSVRTSSYALCQGVVATLRLRRRTPWSC